MDIGRENNDILGWGNKLLTINRKEVIVNSNFGREIYNMFLTHNEGSKNIAILFPGGDNSTDVPTLHYARKAALLCGCDVLSLEYGYKIGYKTLNQPEIINVVIEECQDAIIRSLEAEYKNIFFISKSMGHFISFRVDERICNKAVKHICYTPLSLNVNDIVKKDCIVFTGTKDKLLTIDDREKLLKYDNVELVQIENAVHSLEIEDNYTQSIRILKTITDKCSEYIKKNMVK